MTKKLAIDYGTKRIGLALSYDFLAEPLTIIPNDDQALEKIKQICQENFIEKIIIGLSAREIAEQTKQFAQKLQTYVKLPIEFFDESFSSKEVQQKLIDSGSKQSRRQKPIDDLAAAHFLQEYLDIQGKSF